MTHFHTCISSVETKRQEAHLRLVWLYYSSDIVDVRVVGVMLQNLETSPYTSALHPILASGNLSRDAGFRL